MHADTAHCIIILQSRCTGVYESPIHELSYAVLLVSKLQVFSEIWQEDYRSVGTLWSLEGVLSLLFITVGPMKKL